MVATPTKSLHHGRLNRCFPCPSHHRQGVLCRDGRTNLQTRRSFRRERQDIPASGLSLKHAFSLLNGPNRASRVVQSVALAVIIARDELCSARSRPRTQTHAGAVSLCFVPAARKGSHHHARGVVIDPKPGAICQHRWMSVPSHRPIGTGFESPVVMHDVALNRAALSAHSRDERASPQRLLVLFRQCPLQGSQKNVCHRGVFRTTSMWSSLPQTQRQKLPKVSRVLR